MRSEPEFERDYTTVDDESYNFPLRLLVPLLKAHDALFKAKEDFHRHLIDTIISGENPVNELNDTLRDIGEGHEPR